MNARQLIKQAGKYHASGKYKQADRIYKQLLKLNPNDVTLLRVLGMLERDRRNSEAALVWFSKAQKASKNDPILLVEVASTLEQLGRNEEALQTAIDAHTQAPTNITIAMFIAKLYLARGQASRAAAALEKAIDSDPENVEAWHLLALAVNSSGVLPIPLQFARKLVQLQPHEAQPHATLATAHRLNGDLDASLQSYDQALGFDPSFIEAIAGKAEVWESMGLTDQAHALLEKVPKTDSVLIAFAKSRVARRRHKPEEALSAIDAVIGPHLSQYHRSNVLMLRGRVLEELERYDEAWASWEEGNTLHQGTFDLDAHVELVDQIIQTPINTNGLSDSERPVFIVGMYRSGTTLLEQILGAHPEIDTAGEVNQMLRFVHDAPYPDCVSDPISSWPRQYLERLGSDAAHVTDKMPNNYLHIALIHALFPRATIIHISRNPIDTCVSCFSNSFSASHAYTSDLETLAGVYEQYQRIMAHWDEVLPDRIYEVRYEDIVSNLERTVSGVLDRIGVKWDAACLTFYDVKRIAITPSADQVRRPIYTSSVHRWNRFESHLGCLIPRLQSSE